MGMSEELILKNINRHIRLDGEETDYFLSLLQTRVIRRKGFLLRANEVCKNESFITKGCLRTYTIDDAGLEHTLMFATEDWWTGDLYSFLTQQPSSLMIDATEDTTILQISRANLEQLYQKVPKFERFFRIMFQNAFIAQQERIKQNLSFTAEQRYCQFLDKWPDLEQRLSQKQVASYLGITPEFLSMIRRKQARK